MRVSGDGDDLPTATRGWRDHYMARGRKSATGSRSGKGARSGTGAHGRPRLEPAEGQGDSDGFPNGVRGAKWQWRWRWWWRMACARCLLQSSVRRRMSRGGLGFWKAGMVWCGAVGCVRRGGGRWAGRRQQGHSCTQCREVVHGAQSRRQGSGQPRVRGGRSAQMV